MWQVVLAAAAAAAGSGVLVKKLIHPNSEPEKPSLQGSEENEIQSSRDLIFPMDEDANGEENNITREIQEAANGNGKIFRFSSPQNGDKDLKKKKTWCGFKTNCAKRGKKSVGDKQNSWVDQRTGKKVSVCLKKRRTASGKFESCASKGKFWYYISSFKSICD